MPRGNRKRQHAKIARGGQNIDTEGMQADPPGTSPQAIGARIEILHKALGMNQSTFARYTGVAQSTLSNYKKGTNRLSLDEAFKIVGTCRVTLDWLFFGDPAGIPLDVWEKIKTQIQRQSAA